MDVNIDKTNNSISGSNKSTLIMTLCLYPTDPTTEFLRPIFARICTMPDVEPFEGDAIEEDDFFDNLYVALKKADSLVFLGHGSTKCLYGTNLNPIIDDKSGNLNLLRDKRIILFACRSEGFIREYDLHDGLGFGFIPTTLDDAREGRILHKLDLTVLDSLDLDAFKDCIVRIWDRALTENGFSDLSKFQKSFEFFTNVEIANTLTTKQDLPNFRLVADMLYYLHKDMIHII